MIKPNELGIHIGGFLLTILSGLCIAGNGFILTFEEPISGWIAIAVGLSLTWVGKNGMELVEYIQKDLPHD